MDKQIIETNRFEVEDPDGERYTIVEHTTYIISHSLNEGTTKTESLLHYTTDNGNNVNRTDDGNFKLVATGQTLKRIDS